jgi:hypothetical protein
MPNTPNSVLVLDQFGRVPALGSGIAGVTDGSNARPGSVGEFMQAVLEIGGGGSVATAATVSYTGFTLTPGDWDVWGTAGANPGASQTLLDLVGGISTTDNAFADASDTLFLWRLYRRRGGEASALIASRSVGRTGGIGALASALVSARTLDVLGAEPSGPPPGIMALPAIASLMLGTLLREVASTPARSALGEAEGGGFRRATNWASAAGLLRIARAPAITS